MSGVDRTSAVATFRWLRAEHRSAGRQFAERAGTFINLQREETMTQSKAVEQSIPLIPREAWTSHPHYPSQVLLLGSHESFRRLSQDLVRRTDPGLEARHLRRSRMMRVYQLYRHWIGAMRGHEAYEEYKLYPYLVHRFGVSVSGAQAGHEAMHRADDAVRAAFRALFDNDEHPPELLGLCHEALTSHGAVLNAHLDLEEELVIPCLLALSPIEFVTYYNNPIGMLLSSLGA